MARLSGLTCIPAFPVLHTTLDAGYFFMFFFSSADYFLNLLLQKIIFGTLSVSNNWDPDQDLHSYGSDLGPNGMQRLSTLPAGKEKNTREQSFKILYILLKTVYIKI